MESFSLLKYWRGGGGGAAIRSSTSAPAASPAITEGGGGDDDGAFFDLVFRTLPVDDGGARDGGFSFELSSVCGRAVGEGAGDRLRSACFSPSDDLFFKGKLVALEPSSIVIGDPKPLFLAGSLLKSAAKVRVFLLGLRKPKPTAADPNATALAAVATASPKQPPQSRFFVKFKVEEVPFVSLFTRESSSPISSPKTPAEGSIAAAVVASAEEKRFAREVIPRYLNMIKPLYVSVSRKHGVKLSLLGMAAPEESVSCGIRSGGEGVAARLRAVRKRLGKSRSAVPSPPPSRRDDSLLEQHDGIQSAIAYCKRSLTAPDKGTQTITHAIRNPVTAGDF